MCKIAQILNLVEVVHFVDRSVHSQYGPSTEMAIAHLHIELLATVSTGIVRI